MCQDTIILASMEELDYPDFGSPSFNDGDSEEEILNEVFKSYRPLEETARVYRNDSLLKTWLGPIREMSDSIHHFFSYHSWKFIPDDDYSGEIRFTVLDKDISVK